MKKVVALLFLLSLLVPFWATFSVLYLERLAIREEVKEKLMKGLSPSELTVFQFSKKQEQALEWEHAGEFKYQRQSYDLVKRVEKGDSVVLYCWWDAAESSVNQQLESLIARELGKAPLDEERSQALIKIIKLPYSVSVFEWHANRLVSQQIGQTAYLSYYHSRSNMPPVPPPWV